MSSRYPWRYPMGFSSRNKLGEAFVADVYAKWQKHGEAALERMIEQDPGGFVRVVANILPDKLEVDVKHTISRIERVIVDKVIEHDPRELTLAQKREHMNELDERAQRHLD
jgi:hypothetical protein